MPKTKSEQLLYAVFCVSFIICAFLGSVHFWCFNEAFYKQQHDTLTLYGRSIADHIGITDEDLAELTHFTLIYLNDPKASLDKQMLIKGEMREVFTDDEKAHMVDVRKLNLAADYLLIASAIVLLISGVYFMLNKKDIGALYLMYKKILKGILIFFGILLIWIIIDFDSFWTFFHHIFFAGNDLWLLDLRKDVLIMIVPPDFFNHLVLMIGITFFALIIGSGLILKLLAKRKIA